MENNMENNKLYYLMCQLYTNGETYESMNIRMDNCNINIILNVTERILEIYINEQDHLLEDEGEFWNEQEIGYGMLFGKIFGSTLQPEIWDER